MCKYVRYIRPKCGHKIGVRWEIDPENPRCVGRCRRPRKKPEAEVRNGRNSQLCEQDCTLTLDD
ncbi:hypothetical protein ANO14919_091410 [Xylariales sp. No.14919]|nr:hypothetical protein ANO14919_091410 [Xylariales sp. No.14919]